MSTTMLMMPVSGMSRFSAKPPPRGTFPKFKSPSSADAGEAATKAAEAATAPASTGPALALWLCTDDRGRKAAEDAARSLTVKTPAKSPTKKGERDWAAGGAIDPLAECKVT
mmetsp:Transcript_10572/g.14110  ORF Transcript_10572/g.14110 Transcript_10572/m.14110 type:complete len:112 (-) Transcript_10572:32-367(-)